MRQTKSKNYDLIESYGSSALIIGGHCNSNERKKRCLELLKRCREKFEDFVIIYCSHLPIDSEFYDYIDYGIYNKNNPTINYHIIDSLTDQVKFHTTQPAFNRLLERNVQTSDYAHYLQVYDGVSLAVSQNIDKIHYFSYDVSFDVLDRIGDHQNILNDYEAVFYNFMTFEFLNSEFFSITSNCAKKTILNCLSFDDFFSKGNNNFGHENVYANMFLKHNIKQLGFFHTDDRKEPWWIGNFSTLPVGSNNISRLPSKIENIFIIPYIENESIKLNVANGGLYEKNNGTVKLIEIKFFDQNMNILDINLTKDLGPHCWCEYYANENVKYVEVLFENVSKVIFDITDKKNHGNIRGF